MKKSRLKITSSLGAILIAMSLNVNIAMAFNSIGNNINALCAAEGREPAMPFTGDCTLCHDDGSGGGSGAGKTAATGSPPANLDFFCQLPMANTVPVANAGPDQSVTAGELVTLSGTGSMDADGDPLTYSWSLTVPTGSTATLSGPTTAMPTFVADIAGTYEAELIVNDGTDDSAPDFVLINAGAGNTAPVANAGPDQSVSQGDSVTLDGSGSSDIDGDALIYNWSLTAPTGSTATLSDPTAIMPTFIADIEGSYEVQLIVNDGTEDSAADSVTVTANAVIPGNTPPVANAGMDQAVMTGDQVTLDGSGSSDIDGDPLAYDWSFVSIPTGSTASLSSTTIAMPTFTADVAGDYVVQLIVSDGMANSTPDTVTIRANGGNVAPIADAGMDQDVLLGDMVELDGSASMDADGDALSYRWSLISIPGASTATLSDATAINPYFMADVIGDYVVQLIVNDGDADSAPDTVTISAHEQAIITPVIKKHKLKIEPRRLTVEMKQLGKKAFKVKAVAKQKKVMDENGEKVFAPLRCVITVTKPDGMTKVILDEQHEAKKKTKCKTKYPPTMEGDYSFNSVFTDITGMELASDIKTATVIVENEDEDKDKDKDEDEDEEDKDD